MRRNATLGGASLLLAILVVVVGGCANGPVCNPCYQPAPCDPCAVQPCSPPPCEPQPDNPCNWPQFMPEGQQETADALLNDILLTAQTANEQGRIDPDDWLRISLRVPKCREPGLTNKMGVQVCAVVDPTAHDELLDIRERALATEELKSPDARERWFTLANELDNFPKGN